MSGSGLISKARCDEPPPDMHPGMVGMVGARHHKCCKPAGHELPHINAEGVMWNADYVGWPTNPRVS